MKKGISFGVGVQPIKLNDIMKGNVPPELKGHVNFLQDVMGVMGKHGKNPIDLLHINAEITLSALMSANGAKTTQEATEVAEDVMESVSKIVEESLNVTGGNTTVAMIAAVNAAMILSKIAEKESNGGACNCPKCNQLRSMGLEELDLNCGKSKKQFTQDDVLNMSVKDLLNALNNK